MYRVVIYVLLAWVLLVLGLSLAGELFYSVPAILSSLAVLIAASSASHFVFKWLFKAPANYQSTLISALILFFIFIPSVEFVELAKLAAIAALMVALKYIFVVRKVHLANPVALAAVIAALFQFQYATWWFASSLTFYFILIGGTIITAKIRRFDVVLATIAGGLLFTQPFELEALKNALYSMPILFLATVMVTEPLSMPPTRKLRIVYGFLIGASLNFHFQVGPLFASPELSLVLANLLFFGFGLKRRLILKLKEVKEIAKETFEFTFEKPKNLSFTAGQYLEFTLPHENIDTRGVRRYFTIASSPTEDDLKIAVKIGPQSSSFKQKLAKLKKGDLLYATQRAGDFVLPGDPKKEKLLFIAGGIGITPFRSMIQYLEDQKIKSDIVLIYCNRNEDMIAYPKLNVKVIDVLSDPKANFKGEKGRLDLEKLERLVPDVKSRLCYLSGPNKMVESYKKILKKAGVRPWRVKTDYFPGLS
jgi:ferredoxin-NADP reductase